MQGLGRKVKAWFGLGVMALGSLACSPPTAPDSGPWEISVRFSEALGAPPQDGRLLLLLSAREGAEPRFQVNNNADSQLIFGRNVEGWDGVSPVTFKGAELGFPLADLQAVPPGTYRVQALLNRYRDFTLSSGKTVSLPRSRRGKGNRKPGISLEVVSHPWPRLGAGGDCHGSRPPG